MEAEKKKRSKPRKYTFLKKLRDHIRDDRKFMYEAYQNADEETTREVFKNLLEYSDSILNWVRLEVYREYRILKAKRAKK